MTPHAVSFQGVRKLYGSFAALDGLHLHVPQGEVYGLLGPNGAGKTTAIRVLTGLTRPTEGRVTVLGERGPPRRVLRDVGYMPQETALYADLTVWENLDLFRRLYGMDRDAFEARVDRLLDLVALGDWRDTPVHNLSGGMKHRTSLVAALLPGPRLLVLDEPTVGVDPELRANFWQYFRDLRGEGVTVLITTHYMDEARNCTRVGLLRRGRLIAEDAPAAIVEAAGAADLEDAFLRIAGRTSEVRA